MAQTDVLFRLVRNTFIFVSPPGDYLPCLFLVVWLFDSNLLGFEQPSHGLLDMKTIFSFAKSHGFPNQFLYQTSAGIVVVYFILFKHFQTLRFHWFNGEPSHFVLACIIAWFGLTWPMSTSYYLSISTMAFIPFILCSLVMWSGAMWHDDGWCHLVMILLVNVIEFIQTLIFLSHVSTSFL